MMFINSNFSTVNMLIPAPIIITPRITQIPHMYIEISTSTFETVQTMFKFIKAIIEIVIPTAVLKSFENSIFSNVEHSKALSLT